MRLHEKRGVMFDSPVRGGNQRCAQRRMRYAELNRRAKERACQTALQGGVGLWFGFLQAAYRQK